jgi:hypothetical protein
MTVSIAIVLVVLSLIVGGLFYTIDALAENLDNYMSRRRTWREIDVRSSMERHPSFQASLYDWEKE